MIKIYCDKCGKEITGNVNTVAEETEIFDCYDNVVLTLRDKISHICNECQYNELTCGFKVGDTVITSDGRSGIIESICDCESCKKRGFYEPRVKLDIGLDDIWITDTDKRNGFANFFKIGDQAFGNIDEKAFDSVKRQIGQRKDEIKELEDQLRMLRTIDTHFAYCMGK